MTLGRFLTEYLYIPLGGNKRGFPRELVNVFIVFSLSGIWHGAGWGFIIWGVLHATAMVVQRVYRYILKRVFGIEEITSKIYIVMCWILTFNFINLSWVFFRSESISGAMSMLKSMVGGNGVVLPSGFRFTQIKQWVLEGNQFFVGISYLVGYIFFILLAVFTMQIQSNKKINPHSLSSAFFAGMILMIGLCFLSKKQIFIYFNF